MEKFEYAMDIRDGRYFGPFNPGDAWKYCDNLNDFVAKMANIHNKPFWPVTWDRIPKKWQDKLIHYYNPEGTED